MFAHGKSMNTHTHTSMVKQRRSCHQFSLSLSLYFQENKPSHAALISSKLSDLDALLRKGGAPEVQAPSTPQQQQLIRPVAVHPVCLLSRTRISSKRSSHASEERAQPHLLFLLLLSMLLSMLVMLVMVVVVVVVVAHGPRQLCSAALRGAQHKAG